MTRQDLFAHIADTYGITPDYPFEEDFVTAVFRHTGNRKWFAIAMRIPRAKLGLTGEGHVDVVNLKVSPEMIPSLVRESGVFPAYHMNKSHWVTAALDGTASDEMVAFLTGVSFDLTVSKLKSKRQ
jgi:predicted DNA-binding protein (MmcQ/YjbR family)